MFSVGAITHSGRMHGAEFATQDEAVDYARSLASSGRYASIEVYSYVDEESPESVWAWCA